MEAPLKWIPPATFQNDAPGLGFPRLEGAEHAVIYDPLPCRGNVNEGGDGRYESLLHGTYSHGPKILLYEDKFIVQWVNHSRDEDAAGARQLAKVGTFTDAARSAVRWGGVETMAEIAPPAVPVRRRRWSYEPEVIHGVCVDGALRLINGRLYLKGHLHATHGFSNDMGDHLAKPAGPVPAEHWRDALEGATPAECRNNPGGPWTDVYWDLGANFFQRWKLDERRVTLAPDSPMFKRGDPPATIEVTPGRLKKVAPLLDPYAGAAPLAEAPAQMQEDILKGTSVHFSRSPKYASAAARRQAADGKNGLAHHTEFKRPDGKWVVLRDNLLRMGFYYAAVKDRAEDFYPPAIQTNLPGSAMPAAGELPNGWVWVLCNKRKRYEMYLTLSKDGMLFDRTWSVLTIEGEPEPDSIGKAGGPQYFHALTVGANIWVVYSITKIKIGVTRIPIARLLVEAAQQ